MEKVKHGLIVTYDEMAELIKERLQKYSRSEIKDLLPDDVYRFYNESDIDEFVDLVLSGEIEVVPDFRQEIFNHEVHQSLRFEVKTNDVSFDISEIALTDIFDEYNKAVFDYKNEIIVLVKKEEISPAL